LSLVEDDELVQSSGTNVGGFPAGFMNKINPDFPGNETPES